MFASRRSIPSTKTLLRQTQRRFDSHAAHDHHHHHHHHHAESANVTLNKGFYAAVAAVPVGLVLYNISTSDPSSTPALTRLINKLISENEPIWERYNALHSKAAEQAASDRNLFNSQPGTVTIDLPSPEVFNASSPMNVPAGHSADLSSVVAHYEKKRAIAESERVAKLKDGKVESIYEDERYF